MPVDVDATYPVTMGQLSVWRDVEKMPTERRWEANLTFVWDIPEGHPAVEVWDALAALAIRHESLRTTYVVDADGVPRQCVAAADPSAILSTVRQGTAEPPDLETFESEQLQRVIDVTTDMPWRAWILTTDGEPKRVLIALHHVASDGAGALIMQNEFRSILAGIPLPAADTPRELALRQHGDGLNRVRSSERYWRRTLSEAPRQTTSDTPGSPIGVTLHTGIPLAIAHEGAAKLEVSMASVLLAAYYRALRSTAGSSKILMYPMSSNRFDAETAELVTTLNQWVPLVMEFDEAESFETMVKRVHWKTFNALKYGVWDPDAIVLVRREFAEVDPPLDTGFHYNAILAPPGFPTTENVEPSRVEWYTPPRATGPGFYLIARGIASIDLVIRLNRPGFDKEKVVTFLRSIQDALLGVAGMAETPLPVALIR